VSEPSAPAPAESEEDLYTEVPWKRLHPASLVINLIPRTWRVISMYWPLLLMIAAGRSGAPAPGAEGARLFDAFYLVLLLGSGLISATVHYLTLRYRIYRGRLELRQGLLHREARVIDPARIQNVELLRNPFHKLSGLVEVRLETAGDVRTEGLLSALSVAEAEVLMRGRDALRGRERPAAAAAAAAAPVLRLGPLALIAHGLSSGRAGLTTLLLFGALEVLSVLDPAQGERVARSLDPRAGAGLLLLALSASWLISAGMSTLRHFRYELHQEPGRLRAQAGLFTRRGAEIPLEKVQLARVDEPLLRRWMGFGSLSVETAALGPITEGPPPAELMVPMVERDELARFAGMALPAPAIDPWSETLRRPHPWALWRALIAALLRGIPWIPLGFALHPWAGWAACALLLVGLFSAALDWRLQGWLVRPHVVVARRGFWRRRTWLVPRAKLQSVHLVQGPLMRAHGLGRLVLRVAGSQVTLPDLGAPQAEALLEQLSPRPAGGQAVG